MFWNINLAIKWWATLKSMLNAENELWLPLLFLSLGANVWRLVPLSSMASTNTRLTWSEEQNMNFMRQTWLNKMLKYLFSKVITSLSFFLVAYTNSSLPGHKKVHGCRRERNSSPTLLVLGTQPIPASMICYELVGASVWLPYFRLFFVRLQNGKKYP